MNDDDRIEQGVLDCLAIVRLITAVLAVSAAMGLTVAVIAATFLVA